MIVRVSYNKIEKHVWCEKVGNEYYAYANDVELEFDVDEVEFDYADLEQIVDEYFDDIIDILLDDEGLTKALLKALKKRKNEVAQK